MTKREETSHETDIGIHRCREFPRTQDFHEPPIGTGGGSLFVDVPSDTVLDDPSRGNAPLVYTFRDTGGNGHTYGSIGAVLVVTEKDNGKVESVQYFIPPEKNARLQLWFSGGGSEPGFIMAEEGGTRKITINNQQNRLNTRSTNPNRPNRPLRVLCQNSGVHIERWALVDEAGNPIQDPTSGANLEDAGDDMYYFYVSFHD